MKEIRTEDAVGHILCHDITQIIKDVKKGVLFKKGHIVREEDIPLLLSVGKEHLYVWEKKEGILHENEGAEILYKICAGDSDTMHGSDIKEGKIELIADIDGVLKIRREALLAVNSLGEMMIASRHGDFPVKKGDKLAGTRIIPLVIEKEKMDRAAEVAGTEPIFSILPYKKKKVGIVTGGGSGHKPAFIGYCGEHMADAVAVGEIFSSPTAKSFYDSIRAVDQGMGVAVLYGNYAGDNMNVKMAMELAEDDDIEVRTVVANDDVASAPKEDITKRRGVAGEIFLWKVGGAKAAQGADLDAVISAAQKAIENTRSVGVGLGPCTIPANGKPNFQIEPGTMEFGIGHHGEPGVCVKPLGSAKQMAQEMVDMVIRDVPFKSGDEVAVLVSGLGATPVMEQYIFYHEVEELLQQAGIRVYRSYVGNYFTSLEMNGVTLTMMKLDEELKECLDMDCACVGLTQARRP